MNFIKTLILAAVLASPVIGQEIQPQADANRHYFSVFTHENWQSIPEESRLMAMLEEGSLKKLKDQCHFKHYTDSDEVYVAGRFWSVNKQDFPVLIISNPAGSYFYKIDRSCIPYSADAIYENAKAAYYRNKELQEQDTAQDMPQEQYIERDPILPNAPWNRDQPDSYDIEGIFGGGTPIRDTVAWTGWVIVGLVLLFIMMIVMFVVAPFAIASLYLFVKLFKKD